MAWFALIDSRIGRREFGHGDLFLTREEADEALAGVLKDRATARAVPPRGGVAVAGIVTKLGRALAP